MKRKLLSLLLVMAMATTLCIGCGGSTGGGDTNVNQDADNSQTSDSDDEAVESDAERIERINGRESGSVDEENGIATLYGEEILVHISYDVENVKIWDCNNLIANEYGCTMAEYKAEYLNAEDGDRHYAQAFVGPYDSYENYKQDEVDDAKELALSDVVVEDYEDVKIGNYVLKHFALSYSYEHELTANEMATWNSVLDFYYMELSDEEALVIDFDTTKLESENQNGELESEREIELKIVPYMITNIEVDEAK